MHTEKLLLLTQWLSPNFPVGAFAYSSGLETAIADGLVTPATLHDWLADQLEHGGGRSDAILLRAAASSDPDTVDATARAFCPSRERLLEIDAQGAALCTQLRANWDLEIGNLCYPVALGYGAGQLGLPIDLAVQMYLQAWVGNLVAAAQRLMPLGQTAAQRIVADLMPLCVQFAHQTKETTLEDLCSQNFLADILTMRHETQSPRIFRT